MDSAEVATLRSHMFNDAALSKQTVVESQASKATDVGLSRETELLDDAAAKLSVAEPKIHTNHTMIR